MSSSNVQQRLAAQSQVAACTKVAMDSYPPIRRGPQAAAQTPLESGAAVQAEARLCALINARCDQ